MSNSFLDELIEITYEFTIFLNHPDRKDLSKVNDQPVPTSVDRLVRDAVSALSDTRPPVNFVLFPGGRVETSHFQNDVTEQEQIDIMQQAEQQPIFDGAVANATPALGATQGGGLGTALHAAVALDQPLILALLLVMGADGRACHTAFRRWIVHEAACNGSKQCLRFLLELGHRFGRQITDAARAMFSFKEFIYLK